MLAFYRSVFLFVCFSLIAGQSMGDELPDDAASIVNELNRRAEEIRRRAEDKIDPLREAAIKRLRTLQDRYTRGAKLDEALAIRGQIRKLLGVMPDPGYLHLNAADIGKSFLLEVKGDVAGSIWGSEVYTADSHLATVAVHAGLLKPGQKGILKVHVLPGQQSYSSSSAHGVTSKAYGPWSVSFTVELYNQKSI